MKQLLVFLFLLCSMSVSAQDVIVKKDGSTILSRVLEVGQEEIKYKKFDNLEGPTYTIQKSELQAINYQNGARDTFSASMPEQNRYLPNNQNDGTHAMNDNALLRMDLAARKPYKNLRTLKTIGWIGGGAIAAFGILLIADSDYDFLGFDIRDETKLGVGVGLVGFSAAWTTTFLLLANNQKKKIQRFESSSLLQYNFDFGNGSTLSAGIDMLSDRTTRNNTFGIGLRYNF